MGGFVEKEETYQDGEEVSEEEMKQLQKKTKTVEEPELPEEVEEPEEPEVKEEPKEKVEKVKMVSVSEAYLVALSNENLFLKGKVDAYREMLGKEGKK